MDATIQGLRLPEGFSGMLEDNGLPLPPLPLEAINELEQTDEWFFATDGREPLSGLAGLYLEDLDAVFDSPEAPQGLREGPVRYLGCGLLGGGLRVGSSAICWMRAACASGCRFRGGAHGTIPKRNACPLRRLAALSRPAKPACPNRAC